MAPSRRYMSDTQSIAPVPCWTPAGCCFLLHLTELQGWTDLLPNQVLQVPAAPASLGDPQEHHTQTV